MMADQDKLINTLKTYHSFLDITAISKRDISRKGDKVLAVDNSKLREAIKV